MSSFNALLLLLLICNTDGGYDSSHLASSGLIAQTALCPSGKDQNSETGIMKILRNLALRGGERRPSDLTKSAQHYDACEHCSKSDHCPSCKTSKEPATAEIVELGSVLGHGSFSTVYHANSAKWGSVAVKKVVVVGEEPTALKRLTREIQILKLIDHPNIVKLLDVHIEMSGNTRTASLLFEPCRGGELFDFVNGIDIMSNGDRMWQDLRYGMEQNMTHGLVTESDIANMMRQILLAVSYLHQNKIAHRDLKLENVLLVEPFMSKGRCSTAVKLIDFGFSKLIPDGERMFTACGSTLYIAPEVLAAKETGQGYGLECDAWAVGVMSYILLTCKPPFAGQTPSETLASIRAGTFEFPDKVSISEEARSFVQQLLVPDPKQRATCMQALSHPWIKMHTVKAEKAPPSWEGILWNCVPSALRGMPRRLSTLIAHTRPAAAGT